MIDGGVGLLVVLAGTFARRALGAPTGEEGAEPTDAERIEWRTRVLGVFAAIFLVITAMGDAAAVVSSTFSIPLAAKYVMALCGALPLLVRRRSGPQTESNSGR